MTPDWTLIGINILPQCVCCCCHVCLFLFSWQLYNHGTTQQTTQALASGVGLPVFQFVYYKTKEKDSTALFGFGPVTMWYCASFLYLIAVGLALILSNDKANTSHRHGGTYGHGRSGGDFTPNETTGDGMVINDNDLEEYRQLVSKSDSDEEDHGLSTSEQLLTSSSLKEEEERSLSLGGSADYGTIFWYVTYMILPSYTRMNHKDYADFTCYIYIYIYVYNITYRTIYDNFISSRSSLYIRRLHNSVDWSHNHTTIIHAIVLYVPAPCGGRQRMNQWRTYSRISKPLNGKYWV